MKLNIDSTFTPEQLSVMHKCIYNAERKLATHYHVKAVDKIAETFQTLEITNNGRMRSTAGTALTNRVLKHGTIKMNKRLFSTSGTIKDFENTFLHELAHLYVNFLHQKQCGHNNEWRRFFKLIGGDGNRCHNMFTDHLKAKRTKYVYECKCPNLSRIHHLSQVRHNKIQNKQYRYRCAKCREVLTYGGVKVRG